MIGEGNIDEGLDGLKDMENFLEGELAEVKRFKKLSILLDYLSYLTANKMDPGDVGRIEAVKSRTDELLGIEFDE